MVAAAIPAGLPGRPQLPAAGKSPPSQPTRSTHPACLPPLCVLPQAVTHYNDPAILAEVSCDLGEPMVGIDVREKGFKSYAQRSE